MVIHFELDLVYVSVLFHPMHRLPNQIFTDYNRINETTFYRNRHVVFKRCSGQLLVALLYNKGFISKALFFKFSKIKLVQGLNGSKCISWQLYFATNSQDEFHNAKYIIFAIFEIFLFKTPLSHLIGGRDNLLLF